MLPYSPVSSCLFSTLTALSTPVVRSPEDAATLKEGAYDYVILCVKALPDIYDLASVIDSVVTPQHTCILINTTNSLGVESAIEERFPTNVVLSLVCGAEIVQLGGSEFEHKGSTEVWVGPANKNAEIPPSIQEDMAQALAMTLSTGQVDCKVSNNIRQQQYERVIGFVDHRLSNGHSAPANRSLDLSHSILHVSYLRHRVSRPFWRKLASCRLYPM